MNSKLKSLRQAIEQQGSAVSSGVDLPLTRPQRNNVLNTEKINHALSVALSAMQQAEDEEACIIAALRAVQYYRRLGAFSSAVQLLQTLQF